MKILFISFYFPPFKAIASVRTWNLCKGLLDAGHQVQVVSVAKGDICKSQIEYPPDFEELQSNASYSEVRVSSPLPEIFGNELISQNKLSFHRLIYHFFLRVLRKLTIIVGFDPSLLWSLKVCQHLGAGKDVDLIMVSGGPFSSFLPAYFFSKRNECDLVLDYRDVWHDPPHQQTMQCSLRYFEKLILNHARLVISVSPSCLSSILGTLKKESLVMTNGVSSHAYEYCRYHKMLPNPVVVYAGALYPPKRSIRPFLIVLKILKTQNILPMGFKFIYLGPSSDYVSAVAEEENVKDLIECPGYVSHDEALRVQLQSLCTLVITTVDDFADGADRGVITGKLFEAIEMARKVLVICPYNSDVRSLTSHIRHIQCFTGSQTNEIVAWLGDILVNPGMIDLQQSSYFAWSDIVKPLVNYLDKLQSNHEYGF